MNRDGRRTTSTPRLLMLAAACLLLSGGCGERGNREAIGSQGSALSENLLSDPGFEDDPARNLEGGDSTPWFGEENGTAQVVQGDAHGGSQFGRLQPVGGDSFIYHRFTAEPNTDYTLTFWSRGTASRSLTGSARARFLGDCNTIPQGCPDSDGDEDMDLGPEPPNYDKLILNGATVSGTDDWQQTSVTFNSGNYTELGIVFYAEFFDAGEHLDIDDVSVTKNGWVAPSCDCHGTDEGGNPVQSSVCGSTVCGSDQQIWSCTESDYQPTGQACGGGGSCGDHYGGTNGFQLCFESPTECGFNAVKDGALSCDDVCAAGGGTCVRVLGNDSSAPCVATGEHPDGCSDTSKYDDICVCSL